MLCFAPHIERGRTRSSIDGQAAQRFARLQSALRLIIEANKLLVCATTP